MTDMTTHDAAGLVERLRLDATLCNEYFSKLINEAADLIERLSQVPPEPVGERQSGIDAGLAMGAEIDVHTIARAILIFATNCEEWEQQLPAIQFISNRADAIADTVRAEAISILAARTERGEDNPHG